MKKPARWIPRGGLKIMWRVAGSIPDLRFRLGFRQTDRALAFFPLAALFEQFNPLEPLENGTLATGSTANFERCVLGHIS